MEEKENAVVYKTDEGKGLFVPEGKSGLILDDIDKKLDKVDEDILEMRKTLEKMLLKTDNLLSKLEYKAGDE
jgi:hypothetical protein